ncbi:F-box protein CPR1-like [Malus sylvestris]|uniref:F-box protein CPR1-like n=1 Tax=Malus sylvestris TaxID=3752 RepID=UPI0021AC4D0F|nr:F-box protein CPR1-like [Malus sylvestris]
MNFEFQEVWSLPTFEQQQPSSDLRTHTYFGFGYDSANDDYKILGIAEFFTWNNVSVSCEVSVYSLKSNSWKRIQNLPCNGFAMHNSEIVFWNGALSWLMRGKLDNNQCIILTLDLASEKYQEFDTPVHENGTCVIDLEVLGGSLCIPLFEYCRPLGFSKNGAMVLLKKDDEALVWFDLEGKNVNQVELVVCHLPLKHPFA